MNKENDTYIKYIYIYLFIPLPEVVANEGDRDSLLHMY